MADQVVDLLRSHRVDARTKETKIVNCAICDYYHPTSFDGDCREDGQRFPVPNHSDDEAEFFEDGSPAGDFIPEDDSEDEKEGEDIKVQDFKAGDFVNLKSCPHLNDHESAEFELATVYQIESHGDFTQIGYEGIGGLYTYKNDQTLKGHHSFVDEDDSPIGDLEAEEEDDR